MAVEVLRRESREPVPFADVWFVPLYDLEARAAQELHTLQVAVEERGKRVTCDDLGRARIPARDETTRLAVTAVAEGLWAYTTVSSASSDVTLEMLEDTSLRVRVVDENGRPVEGVPVGLRYLRGDSSDTPFVLETAGPEGLAVFRHVAHCFEWVGDSVNWVVGLEAATEELVQLDFPDDALPTEPVTLELPQTSRVVVTARLADGTPFRGSADVELGIVGAEEEREQSPFGARRRLVEGELVAGRAVFPHVSPCEELEVVLRRDHSMVTSTSYVPGPAGVGLTHSVEVVIGAEHPVLRFRAIDANEAPLAAVRISVESRLTDPFDRSWTSEIDTDADGLFSLDCPPSGGSTRFFFRVPGPAPEAPPLTCEFAAPPDLGPGVHDLGDVRLVEQLPFAAGVVVTPDGQPVPHAALYLRRRVVLEDGPRWRPVDPFSIRGAEDGRFVIRGTFPGDLFQIGTLDERSYSEPLEIRPGATGLVLEARSPGRIRGSVLVDEGTPLELLEIRTRWAGPGGAPAGFPLWGVRTSLTDEGEFLTAPVPPGPYDVVIQARSGGDLFSAEAVAVSAGAPTEDPRLQEIDLRGSLHHFEVRLSSSDDSPTFDGYIVVTDPEAPEGEEHWHNVNGLTTAVLTTLRPVNLRIAIAGYRGVELHGVEGDQEVRLEKSLAVRLLLKGDTPLPEPPLYLKAVLVGENGFDDVDWGGAAFDQDRVATTQAKQAGRLRVQWIIEHRQGGGGATAHMHSFAEDQYVEVLEGVAEQAVEIELSAEQFAELLDQTVGDG